MKKQYVIKLIVCFILTVILITGNIIQAHASQTESGAAGDWSGAQKWEYVRSNMDGLVSNIIGVFIGSATSADVTANFSRLVNAEAIQDNIDFDTWFWQNVQLTPNNPEAPSVSDPSDFNVTNINVSYEFKDILLQATQEAMASNPTGYIEIAIPSISMLDTSMNWTSYGQYKSIVDFCSGLDEGYVSLAYWYSPNTTKVGNVVILYVPKSINYALIGTVTGGVCDITYGIDWQVSQSPYTLSNKIKRYSVNAQGVITEKTDTTAPNPTWRNLTNKTSFGLYGDDSNLMSTGRKTSYDYVFPNINAFKAYNSGNPQPYYLTSSYTGAVTSGNSSYSTSQINSGNSSYQNTVNNIQSGMSADDVIKLVDTIMNNMNNGGGSGGGSGGSGGSDDDDGQNVFEKLLTKIGDAISGIINGIGNALGSIVDALFGYTDENGVEHEGIFGKITNLFTQLGSFINGNVSGFLSNVFGFLPEEFTVVLLAGLTIAVAFMVINFFRR